MSSLLCPQPAWTPVASKSRLFSGGTFPSGNSSGLYPEGSGVGWAPHGPVTFAAWVFAGVFQDALNVFKARSVSHGSFVHLLLARFIADNCVRS